MKELKNFILESSQVGVEVEKPKKNQDCVIFYVDKENYEKNLKLNYPLKYKVIDCEEAKIQKTFAMDLGQWHYDYHQWVYVNGIRFERNDWDYTERDEEDLFSSWVFNAKLDDRKYKNDDNKVPAYIAYGKWLEKIKEVLKSSNKIENGSEAKYIYTFNKEVINKLNK